MVKYEATAVSEMYKEFYQNVVDSNQNYMEKQNAEKVFLPFIVNYFSLHQMVVVVIHQASGGEGETIKLVEVEEYTTKEVEVGTVITKTYMQSVIVRLMYSFVHI